MAVLTDSLLPDILGILIALIAVGYTYYKWRLQYWQRRNVPLIDIKGFGTALDLRGRMRAMYNIAKSKGWRYYGYYAIIQHAFVPVDLELIKNIITKDFNYFIDRGLYVNERDDPISASLFTFGGKKWRHMRAKLSPTFTSGKLKAMFQILVDCGLAMEDYIENDITSHDAVDIKEVLGRFSTNIIGTCAFGIECNTFKDPDSPFRYYSKKHLAGSKWVVYGHLIALASHTLANLLRVRGTPQDVSGFFTKMVEDTVNYRLKNNIKRNDFLQLLIDMKSDKDEKNGNEDDDNKMTMQEIVGQCFLFFIAGFETSSSTMTFALYELSRRQDLQDKVRDELNTILTKYDDRICYDALNELKYMKQVIDETLRIYPAVPFLMRQCSQDYKVPGEDLVIEKGTNVSVPIVGLHYDEDYFRNPTEFDPDRFSDENRKKLPQYVYMPFGDGPRICIGERFGVMQTKVGLACLLRRFKVTLNEKTQEPIELSRVSFLPVAKDGIWLNLEKI